MSSLSVDEEVIAERGTSGLFFADPTNQGSSQYVRSGPEPRRTRFVGIDFDTYNLFDAVGWVDRMALEDRFSYVVTPNAQHAALLDFREGEASWKSAARSALAQSDLCLNDSRVLCRLARFSGLDLPTACGSDLTQKIIQHNIGASLDINLVGGTLREVAWLKRALPSRNIRHFDAPFGVLNDPKAQLAIAEFVEAGTKALTFLAIGAPQSEIVANLIARRGKTSGIALCVGASVEFLSRAKRRAPVWMRHAGLEWLFRLMCEPRRLWRRYLIDCPRVFLVAIRDRKARAESDLRHVTTTQSA